MQGGMGLNFLALNAWQKGSGYLEVKELCLEVVVLLNRSLTNPQKCSNRK